MRSFQVCKKLLIGKMGLEIGGPTYLFMQDNLFPIYNLCKKLDNCNFSSNTIWEGIIEEGSTFQYDKGCNPGKQYIAEAVDLNMISSGAYDFVLSSHTIEHIANPLRALSEWTRVLKEDGIIVLIVPHKDGTFDHRRPITSLEHLIQDFERGTTEEDLSHLQEILALHDLERDPKAGDFQAFSKRSEENFINRCLHHHVFDTKLVVNVVHHMKLQIYAVEIVLPYHILIIAQKSSNEKSLSNQYFLGDKVEFLQKSPFPSDFKVGPLMDEET